MKEEIKSFLEYLKKEKRYSNHTVLSYETDLGQFEKYCSNEFEIESVFEVSRQVIRSWVVSLVDLEMESRTIKRKVSCLKSFFKNLKKNEVIDVDPSYQIVTPKIKKRLPVFVDSKSMDNLLDRVYFGDGFSGARDLLMVRLFYETGIRLSELIGIKESDVNLSKNELKIIGKRNKERIIPVTQEMIADCRAMIELKKEMDFTEVNLLLTDRGKKLYSKFVYRKINKYLSTVTSLGKKSPHVLRHTFATQMLNNGAELNAIKEILGHSSLAATQVYTHNTIDKLKEIYKNTHPKG